MMRWLSFDAVKNSVISRSVVGQTQTEVPARSTWGKPLEFVLSCLAYAIGLGNVWRFPYLCYRNGGGIFIFAYIVMMFLMGMPIFLLELGVGQYSGLGPDMAFANLAPIFTGLGYCTLMVIGLINTYYMVIIGWIVFYFFASFTTTLAYGTCNNEFNTIGCFSPTEESKCTIHETYYNKTCMSTQDLCQYAGYDSANATKYCLRNGTLTHVGKVVNRTLSTEEYFRDYVLGLQNSSWDDFGTVRWQLMLCLLASWIIGYLCVLKGVKTSGKAVYFTALFPYVVLTALVVQGAILEGAVDGILLFISPKWEKIFDVDVWANAASQTFYSFGIGCGSLITLASYSDFHNNILNDVFIVTVTNLFTSVYAGFAIFSMLGFLAHQKGVPVEEVAQDGPSLAFVAYPEAILRLPAPTFWSLIFFLMLFTLGIGSQFAGIEAISCMILDKWPRMRRYQAYITLAICVVSFLLGIPMCFQGGMYLFTLMEWNTASWAIMLIGVAEVGSVAWAYGCKRFLDDMATMLKKKKVCPLVRWYWWACWVILTPLTLLGVFAFQMATYTPATYEDYVFPVWADSLGWLIGLSTLAPLFGGAIYVLCKRTYSCRQLFQPTSMWRSQVAKAESSLALTKDKVPPDQSTMGTAEKA